MTDLATPGPWESWWERDDEYEGWVIRSTSTGEPVVYEGWHDGPQLGVTRADARLIAAAPDLAAENERLQAALRLIADCPTDGAFPSDLKAIAKEALADNPAREVPRG